MKRSDLRRRVSMKLADLEPILEELVKESRIRISGYDELESSSPFQTELLRP